MRYYSVGLCTGMRFSVDFLYLQGGRQSKLVYISIGAVVIRKSILKKISFFLTEFVPIGKASSTFRLCLPNITLWQTFLGFHLILNASYNYHALENVPRQN